MKTFLVKQKFRLGGERFDIKDDRGVVNYQVEGSFFQIPKTFTIYDVAGEQVSEISKEVLTFLPRFEIQIPDIALDTKPQIIKLILISPEGQLLSNDKTRAIPKLNLKTRKQGQDFFTDLTDLFTINIIDGKSFGNLKK